MHWIIFKTLLKLYSYVTKFWYCWFGTFWRFLAFVLAELENGFAYSWVSESWRVVKCNLCNLIETFYVLHKFSIYLFILFMYFHIPNICWILNLWKVYFPTHHCCYWLWGKLPAFGWFLNSFSQGKSKLVNANFCNFSRLIFVLKLPHRTLTIEMPIWGKVMLWP